MSAQAPVKSPFSPEQEKILTEWTTRYPYPNMGLVEALRSVQDWHRMISPETASRVAEIFHMPFSHVWGVATFFPAFTMKPVGKYRIGSCRGLSCWLAGSDAMEACLEKTLGVKARAVTPDGKFSWEPMECLGACEQAPALQVNDRLKGAATEKMIATLAEERHD
ncbi:MAG: NAD(P)H-dependent oxidoreductase subunit E [Elusimicrobia bacterium]|nr:NAD(P)H-dependent oxidoreductase subunit E [Elusimicrobiota bacterium]